MLLRKPLLLLLLLFCCVKGFAATFVVTSNADSGPGTLRDALTQAAANGTTEKDYIYFNFADTSQTGRTINILTGLPAVTSNLIIDGSTQTGGVFGASTARVEIASPKTYAAITVITGSNVDDLEIYGIYFYDYYGAVILYPDLKPHNGIQIINGSNFVFGATGKGNLMRGFNILGLDLENINGVTLKGNLIGFGPSSSIEKDGDAYGYSSAVNISQCNNVQIGGDDITEGNDFFTFLGLKFYQGAQTTVSIKSNNFMVYPDGKSTEWAIDLFYSNEVSISTIFPPTVTDQNVQAQTGASLNMNIENNLTGGTFGIFSFNFINGTVNFRHNYFNIARDGSTNINYYSELTAPQTPVVIGHCLAQFNFGTTDLSQKNLFYYCGPCLVSQNDPNVYVRNNDFKCIYKNYYAQDTLHSAAYANYGDEPGGLYKLPKATIDKIATNGNNTLVNGSATPNSVIDIYSSESCATQCGIRSYLQTVNADNNGNWQATLNNFTGIFWVSATLNSQTSQYSSIQVNSDNINIQQLRCTDDAYITGLTVPQGVSYYWADANGNFVSNNLDLHVTKAGQYQLVLNGGCIRSPFYQIVDNRPVASDISMTVTDPGCGSNNGAINNFFAYDPLNMISSVAWIDEKGKVVSTVANAVNNLPAGSYTFTLKTTDGCTKTYGPVVLKNTTGPNIDQSSMAIQSTPCGQSTGSITNLNITGTGTLKYIWTNSQQQTVGTGKDLINQPAGTYKLEVTDDTQCGPVYSTDITIPETNGITMDETNAQTHAASCGNGNGSVTGIVVTGATQYQWTDISNNIVGNQQSLTNAIAGTYILTASNGNGCSKASKPYTITALAATVYPAYNYTIVNTCPRYPTGSISITTDNLVKSMRWVNSQGQGYGSSAQIVSLPADTYTLYFTDVNGCETLYKTFTVNAVQQLAITAGSEGITPDECNLGVGAVTGVQITGGTEPYIYYWRNANGTLLSTTADLGNVPAGTYKLNVHDASNCGDVSASYTVPNNDNMIAAPSVSNVQLCSSGSAIISVNNASATGVYNLYNNENSTTPADQQTGGKFKVDVSSNTSFYITQVNGTCESSKAKIDVTVGLSTLNIANTFTPNGDGINDFWKINNIENYPQAVVQVFTRYGQKVFESKGYQVPFDGTFKGQKLPAGVYYFIIDLHSNCSLLSGSLTILR